MTKEITAEYIWEVLQEVKDPEIPVLSLIDLGVIRKVELIDKEYWKITMTPTYTGCPAMIFMELDVKNRLQKAHIKSKVETVLSPAWTTDWITEQGREELEKYGIAPPQQEEDAQTLFGKGPDVPCPQCKSTHTELVSQHGSTACKALYKCLDCKEPFDYFKCHK